jgi:hypothetical protein
MVGVEGLVEEMGRKRWGWWRWDVWWGGEVLHGKWREGGRGRRERERKGWRMGERMHGGESIYFKDIFWNPPHGTNKVFLEQLTPWRVAKWQGDEIRGTFP